MSGVQSFPSFENSVPEWIGVFSTLPTDRLPYKRFDIGRDGVVIFFFKLIVLSHQILYDRLTPTPTYVVNLEHLE